MGSKVKVKAVVVSWAKNQEAPALAVDCTFSEPWQRCDPVKNLEIDARTTTREALAKSQATVLVWSELRVEVEGFSVRAGLVEVKCKGHAVGFGRK